MECFRPVGPVGVPLIEQSDLSITPVANRLYVQLELVGYEKACRDYVCNLVLHAVVQRACTVGMFVRVEVGEI